MSCKVKKAAAAVLLWALCLAMAGCAPANKTARQLNAALGGGCTVENGVVTLTGDVSDPQPFVMTEGDVTLDLNGYTVNWSSDADQATLFSLTGGSLTVRDSGENGGIRAETAGVAYIFAAYGAELNIEGGSYSAFTSGDIYLEGAGGYGGAAGAGAQVHITGGTFDGDYPFLVYDDGGVPPVVLLRDASFGSEASVAGVVIGGGDVDVYDCVCRGERGSLYILKNSDITLHSGRFTDVLDGVGNYPMKGLTSVDSKLTRDGEWYVIQ